MIFSEVTWQGVIDKLVNDNSQISFAIDIEQDLDTYREHDCCTILLGQSCVCVFISLDPFLLPVYFVSFTSSALGSEGGLVSLADGSGLVLLDS